MLDKNDIDLILNKPFKELTEAESFVFNVLTDLTAIKDRFVLIGYRLVEAVKNDYYIDLGYKDIVELSENVFGLKKSMTYALMNIAKYYCVGMELQDKYKPFSQSQLIEIARTPGYLCSEITYDMSVRDIIDYRKALSGTKTSYDGIYMSEPKKIVKKYRENKEAEKQRELSTRVENESFDIKVNSKDKIYELYSRLENGLTGLYRAYAKNDIDFAIKNYKKKCIPFLVKEYTLTNETIYRNNLSDVLPNLWNAEQVTMNLEDIK